MNLERYLYQTTGRRKLVVTGGLAIILAGCNQEYVRTHNITEFGRSEFHLPQGEPKSEDGFYLLKIRAGGFLNQGLLEDNFASAEYNYRFKFNIGLDPNKGPNSYIFSAVLGQPSKPKPEDGWSTSVTIHNPFREYTFFTNWRLWSFDNVQLNGVDLSITRSNFSQS